MWSAPAPVEARDVPGADAEPVGAHDELALGLRAPAAVRSAREIRVGLEQPNGI